MKKAAALKLVEQQHDEHPHRLSPVAVTFEEEIKRVAREKGNPIESVIRDLADSTGVGGSQIYNYRSGKTSIPSDLIPIFCKQFESNALAMTLLAMSEAVTEIEQRDAFDLTRFTANQVRDILQYGDQFMAAFEDGKIDGHEETKLAHSAAKIVTGANRMFEVIRAARRRGNSTTPAAA